MRCSGYSRKPRAHRLPFRRARGDIQIRWKDLRRLERLPTSKRPAWGGQNCFWLHHLSVARLPIPTGYRRVTATIRGESLDVQRLCEEWPGVRASQTQCRRHPCRASTHHRMKTTASLGAMQLRRILETSLYADDLDQAVSFYKSVLGLNQFAKEAGRHLFYKLGDQMLLLFNPARTIEESEVAPHGARGPGHIAFAVPMSEMDAWEKRLKGMKVEIEKDVRWPNGGRSLYFRDPAGNCLELASPLVWGMEEVGSSSS